MTDAHRTAPDAYESAPVPPGMRRAARLAGLAAVGGLGLCLLAWIVVLIVGGAHPAYATGFYKAYLFAWMFCLAASLGGLAAVMLHHLTGGEWGLFVRRPGEAAAMVLPLLGVLFVPVLVGLHRLYPWAAAHVTNPIVLHKRPYLNETFFILRYVGYFVLWTAIAWSLRRLSLRHDRTADEAKPRLMRGISAFGMVAYFITMSLASVDWIMSLEPEWYSTAFGFIIITGQGITGTCVLLIVLILLARAEPFAGRLRPNHLNDLGNLLMTIVILWAYNAFAQLLITWMSNMQVDNSWYIKRTSGPWKVMGTLLIFLGFLTPFVLLLMRGVKRRGPAMLWLCSGLLVIRLVDLYWMIVPGGGGDPYPAIHWFNGLMSVIALIGLGGAWAAAFLWLLAGRPLMPLGITVPVRTEPSDELSPEHRVSEHGQLPGTQPGIA